MPTDATSTVAPAAEAPATRLSDILPASTSAPSDTPDPGLPTDDVRVDASQDTSSEQQAPETAADESSIFPQDGETDFADSVYARAAEHYSKQWNARFDPNDPKDRSVLRELIQRGQRIAELQNAQPAEDAADESAETGDETAQPSAETPEQVQQFLNRTLEYAGKMVRPEVASAFAKQFISALYGPKEAEKISPEGAAKFTQTMTFGAMLVMNDLLPQVIPKLIGSYVEQNFPMLGDIHSSSLEQRAIKELSTAQKAGQPLYPGLDKLISNGTIESVYTENPELRGGQFYDVKTGHQLSPLDNKKRELQVVYAIARGKQVNPALLKQVAETSQQKGIQANRNANAGKLAAGESKGAFPPAGNYFDTLIKRASESPEARFSKAAAADDRYDTFIARRSGKA